MSNKPRQTANASRGDRHHNAAAARPDVLVPSIRRACCAKKLPANHAEKGAIASGRLYYPRKYTLCQLAEPAEETLAASANYKRRNKNDS
jgi:hypothetical protein